MKGLVSRADYDGCVGSDSCYGCDGCDGCVGCDDCGNCNGCEGCNRCDRCDRCDGRDGCEDCKDCEDFEDCAGCNGCEVRFRGPTWLGAIFMNKLTRLDLERAGNERKQKRLAKRSGIGWPDEWVSTRYMRLRTLKELYVCWGILLVSRGIYLLFYHFKIARESAEVQSWYNFQQHHYTIYNAKLTFVM